MSFRWISRNMSWSEKMAQKLIRFPQRNFQSKIAASGLRRQPTFYSKSSLWLIGGVLTSGMYLQYQHNNQFLCASNIGSTPGSETQLLHHLGEMKKKVDAKSLLKKFQRMLDEISEKSIDVEKLNSLFVEVGFEDEGLVKSIFDVMDWNGNGLLEPHEVSAVLTLLKSGSEKEKFEFLFYCIDLDHSGKVDKQEMRQMVRALLQARYHIHGLSDRWDAAESFTDIEPEEYRALAKYKSNKIVRDIFDYADTNRDGELNKKEFLRWCRRGGREVDLLTDILTKTLHHE